MDRKLQEGRVIAKPQLPEQYKHIATIEYTTETVLGVHVAQSDKNGRWFVIVQAYDKTTGEIRGDMRGDGLLLSEYSLTRLTAALQSARQKIGSLQTRKRAEAA